MVQFKVNRKGESNGRTTEVLATFGYNYIAARLV